ncbi:MAG: hypothetical protein ABJA78_03275 [Ferruginibacter sp.]
MPQSKNRPHPHHQTPHRAAKKSYRVVIAAAIFFGLVGLGITYFVVGPGTWLIAGAVIGGIVGYFAGMQIEKAIYKK